ncbi:hypothetical protein QT971_25830, partial [Microcoleus sp. herbarium19]|uniref:hypothetical protein n=1 Tax=unclassified Microcoleus TaxID=2642155 RepID=UPI002FD7186D
TEMLRPYEYICKNEMHPGRWTIALTRIFNCNLKDRNFAKENVDFPIAPTNPFHRSPAVIFC